MSGAVGPRRIALIAAVLKGHHWRQTEQHWLVLAGRVIDSTSLPVAFIVSEQLEVMCREDFKIH